MSCRQSMIRWVPSAQRDAPNRVNPDSFEDPKGEFSDSPFPHFKRAPEGNAVGGTRFKDLEEFLEWERKEKRRMRMRPFGGAQAEWDALRSGPGPLYSEKSDMERWKKGGSVPAAEGSDCIRHRREKRRSRY